MVKSTLTGQTPTMTTGTPTQLTTSADGGGAMEKNARKIFCCWIVLRNQRSILDPLDDIQKNSLYFTASNTSEGLDPTVTHYWRWHTYDYYTGVSWGVNSSLVR